MGKGQAGPNSRPGSANMGGPITPTRSHMDPHAFNVMSPGGQEGRQVDEVEFLNKLLIQREQRANELGNSLKSLEHERNEYKERMYDLQKQLDEGSVELGHRVAELERFRDRVRDAEGKLGAAEEVAKVSKARADKIEEEMIGVKYELEQRTEELTEERKRNAELKQKIEDLESGAADFQAEKPKPKLSTRLSGIFPLKRDPTVQELMDSNKQLTSEVAALQREIRKHDEIVDFKSNLVSELETSARAEQGKVSEYQKMYEDTLSQLSRSKEEVRTKDRAIHQLKQDISNIQGQIQTTHTLSHHLSQKLLEVDTLKESMLSTEDLCRNKDNEIEEMRNLVVEKEREIEAKQKELDELDEKYQTRDQYIIPDCTILHQTLNDKIRVAHEQMKAQEETMLDLRVKMSRLETSLQEKENVESLADEKVKNAYRTIQDLEMSLSARDQQIAALRSDLADRTEELRTHDDKVSGLMNEVQSLEDMNKELRRTKHSLHTAKEELAKHAEALHVREKTMKIKEERIAHLESILQDQKSEQQKLMYRLQDVEDEVDSRDTHIHTLNDIRKNGEDILRQIGSQLDFLHSKIDTTQSTKFIFDRNQTKLGRNLYKAGVEEAERVTAAAEDREDTLNDILDSLNDIDREISTRRTLSERTTTHTDHISSGELSHRSSGSEHSGLHSHHSGQQHGSVPDVNVVSPESDRSHHTNTSMSGAGDRESSALQSFRSTYSVKSQLADESTHRSAAEMIQGFRL